MARRKIYSEFENPVLTLCGTRLGSADRASIDELIENADEALLIVELIADYIGQHQPNAKARFNRLIEKSFTAIQGAM